MSEFFQEAYRRAQSRYTQDRWLALAPAEVTQAIYREMRDMDAARPPPPSEPQTPPPRGRRRVTPVPNAD